MASLKSCLKIPGKFKIYSGRNGSLLYNDPFSTPGLSLIYAYQNVTVADVDGDGHAELVVIGYNRSTLDAIRVYKSDTEHGAAPWVGAGKTWNQFSYHVTNINDDGSIPQHEAPSWLLNNTYNAQAAIGQNPNPYLTPNLTASYLRVSQNSGGVHLTVRIGNGGATDAPAGVEIKFYDGNPATGAIIGTVSTPAILRPGDYEDLSLTWTGGTAGVHDIYAVVNGSNAVSECRSDDNQAVATITIEGAGSVFGPDLVPVKLSLSGATTDPQTLAITGNALVTFQNKGDEKITSSFDVLVFEDKDGNGQYTPGVDNLLGSGTNTMALWPNGANILSVPLAGKVSFPGSFLYALVDSGDTVLEQNEGNNIMKAGFACEDRPATPMQPVIKWKWQQPATAYNVGIALHSARLWSCS